jgi:2-methylcitrate dehydratase PrpD
MTATADLARFAVTLSWPALPPHVQAQARRAMLNWFGCAIGGAEGETYEALLRTLATPGAAWLAGRNHGVEPGAAAVLNGFAASLYCFDDTHLETVIHPTAPVLAAALAAAQGRRVDGAALLAALVAGDEVACRIGRALMTGPHPASLGWYMTGVAGAIGAAAAAGRILGLDARRMTWAIGMAASQAAGLRAAHASATSPLVPGLAARGGLTAALLAEAGLDCHDGALEGAKGLLGCFAPGNPADPLTDRLGAHFEMMDLAWKPYPCGVVVHPAIDAALETIARHGRPDPAEIARIEVTVDPIAEKLCLRTDIASVFDAQVSIPHWLAATLIAGEAGRDQARAAWVTDPRVQSLRARVHPTPDPALAPDQARLALVLRDGTRWTAEIAHATGSLANPLTDAALRRKAEAQMLPALGAGSTARLLTLLDAADELADIAPLLAAATPG